MILMINISMLNRSFIRFCVRFREFIYIDDVAIIIHQLIITNFVGILNIVCGNSYSFKCIVDVLNKNLKYNIKIKFRPRSKEKVDHHYGVQHNYNAQNLQDPSRPTCKTQTQKSEQKWYRLRSLS